MTIFMFACAAVATCAAASALWSFISNRRAFDRLRGASESAADSAEQLESAIARLQRSLRPNYENVSTQELIVVRYSEYIEAEEEMFSAKALPFGSWDSIYANRIIDTAAAQGVFDTEDLEILEQQRRAPARASRTQRATKRYLELKAG